MSDPPAPDLPGIETEPGRRWVNWSGSMAFTPRLTAAPRDHEEVLAVVRGARDAGQQVRPVGSGHSSTPLVATDEVLVSLHRLRGVVEHDEKAGLATVLPGTGLSDLGAQLAERGVAMENLGDVDYQAVAGAIGTGTHGTGEALGNLSSTLVGGTLVTGAGETVRFGTEAGEPQDSAMVRAAQVSLGALGIMTSLTLRVRRAYQLRRRNYMTHIDWVLAHFDELAATHRHADFYWYPRSDLAQVRVLDEPDAPDGLLPPGRLRREEQGPSYEIIPNAREIQFDEMEYMLPRDVGLEAFRRVRERVKDRHRSRVGWRVLVRTVAPDQAMLSNVQHRPTMTIALLQNASLGHQEYFADMEPLLLGYGGRPHWGKKHTRTAEQLGRFYPDWAAFRSLRRTHDPDDVLLNDYLRTILEG